MTHTVLNFAEHAKPRSLRADSADRVAPIPPPASPSSNWADEIGVIDAALPATRIVKRRRRLRTGLRPAAQAWPRRAARRLLSPNFLRRRGDA